MKYLDAIKRPADIKDLTLQQLTKLAQEIREELLKTISQLGGHLASSLGAVELCLALHYVFDAPDDQLVWDMGYQAFTHKLITGRRDRFNTLKQFGGLSGFCNKDESPYDLFTAGHGGTVLSTALGLAIARDQTESVRHIAAIIGDASLGEGMALEALNHIGHMKPNLIVLLNDNRMSIAQPVGGLSRYLNRLITNPAYNRLRDDVEQLIKRLPAGSRFVRLGHKVEESVKGLLVPGLVFEELGFRYVGPIDGHNLRDLIRTFKNVKRLKGPILLHVSTVKGKGYRFAEKNPEKFHKIEPFNLATGELKEREMRPPRQAVESDGRGARSRVQDNSPATFTEAFSEELLRIAETNRRVVAITAAMPEGAGLSDFAKRYPDRFLDVGMAEQHALGMAAGLARGGARPIFAVYSSFLQRAYDQIMHEMCLQELPVILAIDRAGLVGEDGPTHHGLYDLASIRVLPNIRILAPKDPDELRAMLRWTLEQDAPVAIRYPRGGIIYGEAIEKSTKITLGKSEFLRPGTDVVLLALGSLVYPALTVAEMLKQDGIDAMVVNARFAKPIDEAMVRLAATRTRKIVTLEEAQVAGGFGSAVSETLDALGLSKTVHLRIGIPDKFIEHGKRHQLLELCRLDPENLTRRISRWCQAAQSAGEGLELLGERSIE